MGLKSVLDLYLAFSSDNNFQQTYGAAIARGITYVSHSRKMKVNKISQKKEAENILGNDISQLSTVIEGCELAESISIDSQSRAQMLCKPRFF